MTTDSDPEAIGPYRIEQRLGSGGMGTVYCGFDERLRRRVALKRIRADRCEEPGARERFLREARTAARLNHPALVHVHDILETGDGDWIVMELAEGPSLARLLEAGPLELGSALALAQDVAGGLAAAHAAGILHRDLKTENVVVTRGGHAKVLDFGLSKAPEDATTTGEGRILGTPRAMSPEQARGHEIGPRSDLFSLGVLLYEMLTGRSPFAGAGPAETLARVCHHEQDPVRDLAPEVPTELSVLVDGLLAKEPAARPASADEVAEALERIAREARREEAAATAPPAPAPGPARLAAEAEREPFQFRGERRQLTLLCCELTGASLDPDVLFEVLPPFLAAVNEAIERYEGHLRDVQGHRFVACFGYPRCHEDNTRRAVLTALRIVARTESVAPGFKARAGVHTGPAVILSRETGDHLSLGETLDRATALQERAEPGSVLVSALTRRIVAGFFEDKALEAGNGVEAFRVVAARKVPNRVEAADNALTPFVGREAELALLVSRFELAREGVGQAVLITGEVGVGKSRLLLELRERLGRAVPRWISGYGSPYARNLPLHPVGGLLSRLLKIDESAAVERQLVQMEEGLSENGFPVEEAMPLFATLLGLPGGDVDLPVLRRGTLEAVPAVLREAAERRPLVVAFEDLHLVDSMTLELIGRMIDQAALSPTLLLLTCRLGFRTLWGHRAQLTQLRLRPLGDGEVDTLIDSLDAGESLSSGIQRRIVARAQGIPLFAEEIVRNVVASDLSEHEAIPATLHDVLATRLDRLGAAFDTARIAAVLGVEVSHEELGAVSSLDETTLNHELDRLLSSGVLSRGGTTGPAGFSFQHALVRDVASASLLVEDRERLLRRLAAFRER